MDVLKLISAPISRTVGVAEVIELTEEQQALAIHAADAVGAEFRGRQLPVW